MKTSLVAVATAFALAVTLGASGGAFAQDATTPEECLVEEGAGATPTGDSLATETDNEGDEASDSDSANPPAEGLEPALGEAVEC